MKENAQIEILQTKGVEGKIKKIHKMKLQKNRYPG